MNINNFSSMKKYQFFEESLDKTNQNVNNASNKTSSLTLNDISPSGINQMQAIEDILFICGKAIHKINSQILRESLILKIINNKIYDEYRMFNKLYYDFKIKYYKDKFYFIVLGGDLIRFVKDKKEDELMVTSIKIYEAYHFIEPKYDKYIDDNIDGENYSKSLIKKIEILKKIDENEFILGLNTNDKSQYANYESFQNVISLTIDSNFTHIAISSIKGDIILISGYPDLIQCDKNKIRMEFLPKIIPKNREIFISNIEFTSYISKNNSNKIILYASTSSSVYYYQWKEEINSSRANENRNIKLKTLIEDKGAYNSCLNSNNNFLIIALTNDNYLLEYRNLTLENSYYFEGNKIFINYFKEYILLITSNIKYTTIQIYDKNNNFLLYSNTTKRKILSVCCTQEFIYIFLEESQNKKYIVKIKEKENKIKFEIFYSKNEYDLATDYALKIKCHPSKLAEISRRYAEYEYSKGDYEIAIKQYIKTINYLEQNTVIEKFLEKNKLDYLILYLEALQNNEEFQKSLINNNNIINGQDGNKINNIYLIGLLFNCYIVQEKLDKFKFFLKGKNKKDNYNIIKTAIDICIESNNINLAIEIAHNKNMTEEIIHILIFKQNKISEALDILLPIIKANKINNDIINEELIVKEKLNLIIKYGQYFLIENNGEIPDLFFNRVSSFIEGKKMYLEQKDIFKIIQIFMVSDKYFKIFFDKIDAYGIEYDEKIIQRRIELFLEEKDENYKLNILKMLKDKKYMNKFNKENLMILFKYNKFKEGINMLKEISNQKQDLIQFYIENKNYDKLIEIIDNIILNNEKIEEKNINDKFNPDLSFIVIILKFFISQKNKNADKKLDVYIKNILNKISNSSELFFAHDFIKILYELNNEFSLDDLNIYINNIINKENLSLSTALYHLKEINKSLEKTEKDIHSIKTEAIKFKLNKCNYCNMTINFPCVFFYCGHSFHQTCLNGIKNNINEIKEINNDKIKCPRCNKLK